MVRRVRALPLLLLAAALLGAQGGETTPPPAAEEPVAEPDAGEPGADPEAVAPEGAPLAAPAPKPNPPFELLGVVVPPGEKRQLALPIAEEVGGVGAPIHVAHGVEPGPVLCIAGGIHGDELNGVEIARSVAQAADPTQLRGTFIVLPIVNLYGFRRGSRYLADRRDLNRVFPGRRRGSLASRIAYVIFTGIVRRCSALVDLHSASFHRTNLPQIRGDLNDPATLDLALAFDAAIIVHNPGRPGTLRRAATDNGIPAITYEAGEPMRFQREEIERGVLGIERILGHIGMRDEPETTDAAAPAASEPPANETPAGAAVDRPRLYWDSRWVRADYGGILLGQVALGTHVEQGELLGTVTDPLSNETTQVFAPRSGTVIGMALDQMVVPGFALFHVASPVRQNGDGRPEDLEALDFDDNPPVELGPDEGEE